MQFKEFLEQSPIGDTQLIDDLIKNRISNKNSPLDKFLHGDHEFNIPIELDFYCESDRCKSTTYFELDNIPINNQKPSHHQSILVEYTCRNCKKTKSKFALTICINENFTETYATKFGQSLLNREPLPTKALKMIGSERDYFFKGLTAESHGLGIASFAYYRRVIEHQKNKLLDEIIKATAKLETSTELINQLNIAKEESQFSKSIELIKVALPQKILINGQNPLSLLYSALSQGLHNENDIECLSLAKSIRLILIELANNLHQVNDENIELNNAISSLLSKRNSK